MSERTVNLERVEATAKSLEKIGVFYGDMLFTCARIFPTLVSIEDTRIEFDSTSGVIAGGLDSARERVVHMGLGEVVEAGVRQRLVRRFGLPIDPTPAYNKIFRRIILGHELGHVLQADKSFKSVFGEIDQRTIIPEDGYLPYVNSDKEMNADYIAAQILGNSALGTQLGYAPPEESPPNWRHWAATRQF